MLGVIIVITSVAGLKSPPVKGLTKKQVKAARTGEKRLNEAMARFGKAAKRMQELVEMRNANIKF
jgi:hypothetical protein